MSQPLNSKQLSFLRSLAHHLNAVVQIGKSGITEAVVRQVGEQLRAHELIKVRFGQEAPIEAKAGGPTLAHASDSHMVQSVGRTVTLYRRHDHKPKLALPGAGVRSTSAQDKKQDPRLSLRRRHSAARRASLDSEQGAGERRRPRQTIDRLKTSSK